MILYGGYNLAPEIVQLIKASRPSTPKVAVYETAVPNPLIGKAHNHSEIEHAEEHTDHAEAHSGTIHPEHGDEDPVIDPHIWHSAANNAAMVEVIAANLQKINPEHANLYRQRAAQLSAQFVDLDNWIKIQVVSIPPKNRKLVTIHNAFRYFAEAYGLEIEGALAGLSTEEKPSAGRLAELIDQVKAAKTPAIFAETSTNLQLINTVAREAGVVVAQTPLYVEGPGGPGSPAETMHAMLAANTCTIVNALGGTCELGGVGRMGG